MGGVNIISTVLEWKDQYCVSDAAYRALTNVLGKGRVPSMYAIEQQRKKESKLGGEAIHKTNTGAAMKPEVVSESLVAAVVEADPTSGMRYNP